MTRAGGGRASRGLIVALSLLVVAVAALWAAAAQSPAAPYDPTSTGPQGAKALALLLRQLGDKVTTGGPLPAPRRAVALLLYDQLDDASRAQVTNWVRRGGTLVVADPASPLAGASPAYGAPDELEEADPFLAPSCDADWVAGVNQVATEANNVGAADYALQVPAGATACFEQGDGNAFAVDSRQGAGVVVSLGGADLWSNAGLADQDNALLAADLLAPGRGYTVAWLTTPWVAGGSQALWSLVPGRARFFLLGLVLALVVACLWQARRHGRPVLEEPLVPVPGSELVLATGRLLARNRRFQEAAVLMRSDLSAQLRGRLGQGRGTSAATLASVVAAHSELDRDEVISALTGPPPQDEPGLLELARSLQHIREEVLGGRTPRG